MTTPQIIRGIDQGSEEWKQLRLGYITGSVISQMMAKGGGITRDKLKAKLAIERMTGKISTHGYKSLSMLHGNECETDARQYYEFFHDCEIEQVAFIKHPILAYCGASPDGLIGNNGLLEIKCPDSSTHIEYLLTSKVPTNYLLQTQWQMSCTRRDYCDFMSYDPDMPNNIKSLIIRVERDQKKINELEREAEKFNEEIEQLIKKLRSIK